MLRILGIADLGEETLRVSDHTFTLEWPASLGQPFYWRAGLVSGSLLEIGMHCETGRIKKLRLVIAKRVSSWPNKRASITATGFPEQNGSPVFHVEDEWGSDPDVLMFDAPEDVWVYIGEHRIALDFGDYERVASCIHNERVSFGMDQNGFLYTIEVGNLTDEEMSNLRQHVRFPSS